MPRPRLMVLWGRGNEAEDPWAVLTSYPTYSRPAPVVSFNVADLLWEMWLRQEGKDVITAEEREKERERAVEMSDYKVNGEKYKLIIQT